MLLKPIDKSRYQRHLRITFAAIAVALAVLAIAIANVLISLLSTPEAAHFWHNFAGVVVAAVIVVLILKRLRNHPFLAEVVYVWDLKQILNRIYRKQRKIEERAEQNDHQAMIVLNFQYQGSRQLYELDDNTLTIDDLSLRSKRLQQRMQEAGVDTSTELFEVTMLDNF